MWDCPKCGTLIDDDSAQCWMCGESRAAPPRPVARQDLGLSQWLDGDPNRPPAGVTRRFGLNRLMLITALFAVTFAVLRTQGARPAVYAAVAAAIVVVGLAQAFLYGGKKPRRASVAAGVALGALTVPCAWVVNIYLTPAGRHLRINDLFGIAMLILLMGIPMGVLGGLAGYVVGCVVAGTFLSRPGTPQDEDLPPETVDPLAASPDEPDM